MWYDLPCLSLTSHSFCHEILLINLIRPLQEFPLWHSGLRTWSRCSCDTITDKAWIWTQAWELPYSARAAIKRPRPQKRERERERPLESISNHHVATLARVSIYTSLANYNSLLTRPLAFFLAFNYILPRATRIIISALRSELVTFLLEDSNGLREKAQVLRKCSGGPSYPDCCWLSGLISPLLRLHGPQQPLHVSSHTLGTLLPKFFEHDISPPEHLDGLFFKPFAQLSGRCLKYQSVYLKIFPMPDYFCTPPFCIIFFVSSLLTYYRSLFCCSVFCLPSLKCKFLRACFFSASIIALPLTSITGGVQK